MIEPSQSIRIIEAEQVTGDLLKACQRLVLQLTSSKPALSLEQLQLLLASESSTLFLVIDQQDRKEEVIGMATLILYRVPTGLRGYIEDVVVERSQRRRGIGEALMDACLAKAQQAGCPQVMLTCNPGRTAANRLYQRMGFELRKTNVYKFRFVDEEK